MATKPVLKADEALDVNLRGGVGNREGEGTEMSINEGGVEVRERLGCSARG